MSGEQTDLSEIKVDIGNLYLEEAFTDLKVASFRRLSPVKPDGSPDESRDPVFAGETHVMTPSGPVPIQCRIEAKTLEEAAEKFPAAIKKAVNAMVDELRELQRREAGRIVVPKTTGPGDIHLP